MGRRRLHQFETSLLAKNCWPDCIVPYRLSFFKSIAVDTLRRQKFRFGEGVHLRMKILQFPNRKTTYFERGKAVLQPNRPYLSTEEVAQLFGFSVRTITAWAAEWQESGGVQGIPGFKMGRSWRFDRDQIQALIDGKKAFYQSNKRTAASA
jgi:excisionase family DNA binding protein